MRAPRQAASSARRRVPAQPPPPPRLCRRPARARIAGWHRRARTRRAPQTGTGLPSAPRTATAAWTDRAMLPLRAGRVNQPTRTRPPSLLCPAQTQGLVGAPWRALRPEYNRLVRSPGWLARAARRAGRTMWARVQRQRRRREGQRPKAPSRGCGRGGARARARARRMRWRAAAPSALRPAPAPPARGAALVRPRCDPTACLRKAGAYLACRRAGSR